MRKETREDQPRLSLEDGLFRLEGLKPAWIWAQTCSNPKCDCRDALVLVSTAGAEELLTRASPVHEAWLRREDYPGVAQDVSRTGLAFHLDIDTAEPHAVKSDANAPESRRHPEFEAILELMDGEALDALGRLWRRGKGLPDLREAPRRVEEFGAWKPGATLVWDEVWGSLRRDLYLSGDGYFEATEHYCVTPGCDCGNTIVDFSDPTTPREDSRGAMRVHSGGTLTIEADAYPEEVTPCWDAFLRRHPRYLARFARRAEIMREFGVRLAAWQERIARPKPGRNTPCPCGSGLKYKKCCAGLSNV